MKRQDSLQVTCSSSSSHRENATEKLQAKAVGCMSGFFHFFSSNYHNRTKLLTFGKRQQKKEVTNSTISTTNASKTKPSSSSSSSSSSSPSKVKEDRKPGCGENVVVQRHSCEAPRSPTLRAEIRRSDTANLGPQNFRRSPALLARLMGLEEAPSAAPEKEFRSPDRDIPAVAEDSSAEKRRRLLGALEKCDRDLKALKRIIDAVRSAERLRQPASALRGSEDGRGGDAAKGFRNFKGLEEFGHAEQPSPVSVLDEFNFMMARSPLSNHHSKRQSFSHGKMQPQLIRHQKKKPGEENFIGRSIFDRITYESLQRKPIISTDIARNVERPRAMSLPPPYSSPTRPWSNKAMKDSVEQACKDIAWGEKREIGRIGLALQDHIFRDLIEELVIDLGSFHFFISNVNSLPFEACKRRLCF